MAKGENAQENHCYKSETTLHHVRFAVSFGIVSLGHKEESLNTSGSRYKICQELLYNLTTVKGVLRSFGTCKHIWHSTLFVYIN